MNELIIMLACFTIVDIIVVAGWVVGKLLSFAYNKLMEKRG